MIEQLKSELEEIAFMLGEDAERKDIHSKVIKCLVILENSSITEPQISVDQAEVNKVKRRLKMWAKPDRQSQYNSQILNAFLKLSASNSRNVTEQNLSGFLGNPVWFTQNFNQMKSISDRNHGKVFEEIGSAINIWEPIKPHVSEYQKQVFATGI
ncbi:hypothetical protein [Thiomicrorhabdus indica]|uniref:hypothetical protein n=1 Tax=Thiomicrorhabdus indica TaxID=2267253 RepID=UPI002AA94FED|nr:hypothetical protein [Thiomicrorhabdus indica]